jgi:hypothetical protein
LEWVLQRVAKPPTVAPLLMTVPATHVFITESVAPESKIAAVDAVEATSISQLGALRLKLLLTVSVCEPLPRT